MTDKTEANAPDGETPMQRALRLKKAAQGRHGHGHGPKASSGKVERASAAAPTGKSKPWMTR